MPERITTLTCNHHWTPNNHGTFECADCAETTHACNTCQRPADTANNACTRCLNRYKQTLADIDDALAHPMAPILHLKATRYDASPRAGSEHMPLGVGQELDDPEELAAQLSGTGRTVLELTRNPKTLGDALKSWAEMWAEHHDHQVTGNPTEYLRTMTIWASNNVEDSAWHDHWKEIHHIRKRLWHLVGLNPQYEPTPCVFCGSTLKREWTANGLTDTILCTNRNCERRVYRDEDELAYLNRTYIKLAPNKMPEALLTREQIRVIYPDLKRNTLNVWIKRGHIKPADHDERGQDLYRLDDLTQRLEQA